MSRTVFPIGWARLGIASKHFDKPPTRDGVPNDPHHQFVGRNAFRRIDECSEIGRGPFHCGDSLENLDEIVKDFVQFLASGLDGTNGNPVDESVKRDLGGHLKSPETIVVNDFDSKQFTPLLD